MHKPILCLFLSFTLFMTARAQKASGKLKFEAGKTYVIRMDIKNSITQQAASQAIDFSADGSVFHFYKVASTGANTSLLHQVGSLSFHFDGMGQKRSFDSATKKFGQDSASKLANDILSKQYELIVANDGTVVSTDPEKIKQIDNNERVVILNDLLDQLASVIYPPKKGSSSFFKVLPDHEVAPGDSWTETNDAEKSTTVNTLTAITDSTIIVEFKSNCTSTRKSEMMGTEATTKMNYSSTGTIIIDKATGIIREKKMTTNSNGNTQAMNSSLPITGKTIVVIQVFVQ
jgi:hypothetical protein